MNALWILNDVDAGSDITAACCQLVSESYVQQFLTYRKLLKGSHFTNISQHVSTNVFVIRC
jgi:hypothetical protein